MRRRLWLSASAVAVAAVLVAAVPLLVVAAKRDHYLLALGLPLLVGAIAVAVVCSGAVARRAARPVEELAEAAGRLGTGDPRPVGRRYGVTEFDQVADGLDSASRRVTKLLTADRELAIDASHQLRTPLTALSMRLEEMIASADDPDVVREEGTAALAQAERLVDVVSQLLSPARRVGAGSAGRISVDKIVLQQITEWEPAFRRAGRKMVLIGESRLQAYVTPGGLAQVIATLLDNALMHGKGTVTIRRSQSASSVVIEVEDEGNGVPGRAGVEDLRAVRQRPARGNRARPGARPHHGHRRRRPDRACPAQAAGIRGVPAAQPAGQSREGQQKRASLDRFPAATSSCRGAGPDRVSLVPRGGIGPDEALPGGDRGAGRGGATGSFEMTELSIQGECPRRTAALAGLPGAVLGRRVPKRRRAGRGGATQGGAPEEFQAADDGRTRKPGPGPRRQHRPGPPPTADSRGRAKARGPTTRAPTAQPGR